MARHGKSFEEYHAVPDGWDASSILAAHTGLGGTFDLRSRLDPERYAPLLRYRSALYAIAEGLRASDPACVELAVRFIELQHVGFYSGFLRALFARRLKHVSLAQTQRERLSAHFLGLLRHEQHFREFRQYLGLWRTFIPPSDFSGVRQLLTAHGPSHFASEVERKLRPP